MSTRPRVDLQADINTANKRPMRAPTCLSKEQKKVWREVLSESPHINTEEYKELLVVYVMSYERFIRYSSALDSSGPLIKENDKWKKNPLVDIVNAQSATISSLSTKLSLTYRSRKQDVGKKDTKNRDLTQSRPKAAPRSSGKPNLRIA